MYSKPQLTQSGSASEAIQQPALKISVVLEGPSDPFIATVNAYAADE
jgi:hypothetical protein